MTRLVSRWTGRALVAAFLGLATLTLPGTADAKRKRIDDQTLEMAVEMAKDREKFFAGESAMSAEEFQAQWAAFAERMASIYEGHEVRLKQFGTDVRYRKGFAHILYLALRSQTRGIELTPPAQDLVSKHPFLQELVIKGSCYTGGDPFPKKMQELLEANPGIPFLLAEQIDSWDNKHKKAFTKAFPKAN